MQVRAKHPLGICRISKTNMLIRLLKKRATLYCIHVLPMLNRRGWKQLNFKNVQDVMCSVIERIV